LKSDCSQDQIRDQYKRMVQVFHPDHHRGDTWCEDQLRLCNKAYEILGDPLRKQSYDLRYNQISPEPSFSFSSAPASNYEENDDEEQPWVFTAQDRSKTYDDPEFNFEADEKDFPQAVPMEFGNIMVGASWPVKRNVPVEPPKPKKSSLVLIAAAALSGIIALVIILLAGNDEAHNIPKSDTSAIMSSVVNAENADMKSPIVTTPQTNIQTAELADQRRAKLDKKTIGPFWTRYELDQKLAANVITDAEKRVHSERRILLTSKSQALQQTSTSIQYQFDDITYGSQSDSPSAETKLSSQLTSLESQIKDIQGFSTDSPASEDIQTKQAMSHSGDSQSSSKS
jgi:curved DNA-binding protein CbpA